MPRQYLIARLFPGNVVRVRAIYWKDKKNLKLLVDLNRELNIWILTVKAILRSLQNVACVFEAFLCFVFRAHLEEYIEHLPLETDKKAMKVLRLCEDLNMLPQGDANIKKRYISVLKE